MSTISRLLLRYRAASVRRWICRQEAAAMAPNAYEIHGHIRGRWRRLSEDEAMQILEAAAL